MIKCFPDQMFTDTVSSLNHLQRENNLESGRSHHAVYIWERTQTIYESVEITQIPQLCQKTESPFKEKGNG